MTNTGKIKGVWIGETPTNYWWFCEKCKHMTRVYSKDHKAFCCHVKMTKVWMRGNNDR